MIKNCAISSRHNLLDKAGLSSESTRVVRTNNTMVQVLALNFIRTTLDSPTGMDSNDKPGQQNNLQ